MLYPTLPCPVLLSHVMTYSILPNTTQGVELTVFIADVTKGTACLKCHTSVGAAQATHKSSHHTRVNTPNTTTLYLWDLHTITPGILEEKQPSPYECGKSNES